MDEDVERPSSPVRPPVVSVDAIEEDGSTQIAVNRGMRFVQRCNAYFKTYACQSRSLAGVVVTAFLVSLLVLAVTATAVGILDQQNPGHVGVWLIIALSLSAVAVYLLGAVICMRVAARFNSRRP